jgi:hypothetical protein
MRYATVGGRWHLPTPVKKSDPLILRGNSCCLLPSGVRLSAAADWLIAFCLMHKLCEFWHACDSEVDTLALQQTSGS